MTKVRNKVKKEEKKESVTINNQKLEIVKEFGRGTIA